MLNILKRYSTYTLLVALLISAISAYYSIIGLTAIFAAAVVPIIIMGAALELGKLIAAVWLKLNWHRSPLTYKLYLVPAVAFLMTLTSMGIFGFLSKAHSDQSLVSGDSMAKIAVYDEKIKVSKDNIDVNRKALKQMDEAVDQVMGRSNDEKGADKAVQIRRSQQKERARLLADIDAEQKKISQLMEDRAPLAAENRKIEAEVGPIKYIAALIYGDSADSGVLEKAVRFVIIMIVAVFDPLALVLILAAQQSMRWEREDEERQEEEGMKDVEDFFKRARATAQQLDREAAEQAAEFSNELKANTSSEASGDNKTDAEVEGSILDKHPYLNQPFSHFTGLEPMVYKPESEVATKPLEGEEALQVLKDVGIVTEDGKLAPEYGGEEPEVVYDETVWEPALQEKLVEEPTVDSEVTVDSIDQPKILAMGVDVVDRPGDYLEDKTKPIYLFDPQAGQYVNIDGKSYSIDALKVSNPEMILKSGETIPNTLKMGDRFPSEAYIGDLYMKIDTRPHKLFKFNGIEWIHVNKNQNTSYLQEQDYLQLLVDLLNGSQYLPEMLTESEEEAIREYLEQK
jgi:hypothetical protein